MFGVLLPEALDCCGDPQPQSSATTFNLVKLNLAVRRKGWQDPPSEHRGKSLAKAIVAEIEGQ